MTPTQCRAARTMLSMTREELARRSGVSLRAIAGFENGETKLIRLNFEAVRQALEAGGVEFIGTRGVQLKNG
jgi:transcriptional regulator with XRE-family HTH domain